MARTEARSLRYHVENAPADQFFFDRATTVRVADLNQGTSLGGRTCRACRALGLIATQQFS